MSLRALDASKRAAIIVVAYNSVLIPKMVIPLYELTKYLVNSLSFACLLTGFVCYFRVLWSL